DELVLIGSTNVGQRSMTYDGELHLGVVDGANMFARDLRKSLWAEHSGRPAGSLDDPAAAYALIKSDVVRSAGMLKPYPVDRNAVYPPVNATQPPRGHGRFIREYVDPYAGPPELR